MSLWSSISKAVSNAVSKAVSNMSNNVSKNTSTYNQNTSNASQAAASAVKSATTSKSSSTKTSTPTVSTTKTTTTKSYTPTYNQNTSNANQAVANALANYSNNNSSSSSSGTKISTTANEAIKQALANATNNSNATTTTTTPVSNVVKATSTDTESKATGNTSTGTSVLPTTNTQTTTEQKTTNNTSSGGGSTANKLLEPVAGYSTVFPSSKTAELAKASASDDSDVYSDELSKYLGQSVNNANSFGSNLTKASNTANTKLQNANNVANRTINNAGDLYIKDDGSLGYTNSNAQDNWMKNGSTNTTANNPTGKSALSVTDNTWWQNQADNFNEQNGTDFSVNELKDYIGDGSIPDRYLDNGNNEEQAEYEENDELTDEYYQTLWDIVNGNYEGDVEELYAKLDELYRKIEENYEDSNRTARAGYVSGNRAINRAKGDSRNGALLSEEFKNLANYYNNLNANSRTYQDSIDEVDQQKLSSLNSLRSNKNQSLQSLLSDPGFAEWYSENIG